MGRLSSVYGMEHVRKSSGRTTGRSGKVVERDREKERMARRDRVRLDLKESADGLGM